MTARAAPAGAGYATTWARRLVAALLVLAAAPLGAQRTDVDTLQAAYVVNFVRYSQWPGVVPGEPLVIAAVGPQGVGAPLQALARRIGEVDGHAMHVRPVVLPAVAPRIEVALDELRDRLAGAHVVFVAPTHGPWHDAVIVSTRGQPVLTVGTAPGFVAAGGMLELFESGGHVHFAANAPLLAEAPVRVSARVIALARPLPEAP